MSCDRGGFTLAEILVSLIVLEVGLLGVAGVLIAADRTLNSARDLEWAVQEARAVADSLIVHGAAGGGVATNDVGTVRWQVTPGDPLSEVRIVATRRDGRTVVDVTLWAPSGEDERAE